MLRLCYLVCFFVCCFSLTLASKIGTYKMGSVVAGARAPRQPNARSTSLFPQDGYLTMTLLAG
jgi:hypothetical protein